MSEVDVKKSRASIIMAGKSNKSLTAIRSCTGGMKSLSRMRVRKKSFGFGSGVAGLKGPEKSSQIAFEFKRPTLNYSPTYQLWPHRPFHVERVTTLVEDMINENFTDHRYNSQESPALAIRLSGEIMREVKDMEFNRFRIITVVTIGQKRAQSFNNAVAFIWDHERDNYVETHRETTTAFIQVTVFAVYLD